MDCKADIILKNAVLAGRTLLESGAETYRVEDTIVRICRNYGMEDADCFSTLTGLMASCEYEGKRVSIVARIKRRSTNLKKIIEVNELSRHSKEYTIEQFSAKLKEIRNGHIYSVISNVIFAFVSCFGFNLLFNGVILDSFYAGVFGGIIRYMMIKLAKYEINDFFNTTILSAITMLMALVCYQYGLIVDYNITVVSTIMLLVPGLAITNAIYDTLAGDLVSGITRAIEACMVALAIAFGSGFVTFLWIEMFGQIKEVNYVFEVRAALQIIGAVISVLGYGIIFNTKRKFLFTSAIGGGIGFAIYVVVYYGLNNMTLALFLSSMAFSVYSDVIARVKKAPATVFLLLSLILVVPGNGMYQTMLLVVSGDPTLALWSGLNTIAIAVTIAIGVIFGSTTTSIFNKIVKKK